MKKIYQNPKIEIIKVQTTQMIANSPGYGGTTDANRNNLSRQDGGWDDED